MKTLFGRALFVPLALSGFVFAPNLHAQNSVSPGATSNASAKAPAKNPNRALDADLVAAVLSNDIKKVRKLLGRNADPNAKGSDYALTSALCSAASNGYLEVMRALVEAGADVEGGDQYGNVPLMVAALNDRAEAIRYLLQKGAKIEGERKDSLTALKTAATLGKNDALRVLIANGADVNTQKDGSLSPLMAAAMFGNVETVRALVANGANINACLESNATALTHAAANSKSGNLELVKILVEAGADVGVAVNGKKPYEIAASNKLYDIEKYLVDIFNRDVRLYNVTVKANLEEKTATSSTRLARFQEFKEELAKGANPCFTSPDGYTTLTNFIDAFDDLISTLPDNDATVKTLLARSDLNAQKKSGSTALHIAVQRNNLKMVGWLINAGAKLNLVSQDKTPLDYALRLKSLGIKSDAVIALLQKAGAKTSAQLQPNVSTTSSTRSAPTPQSTPTPNVKPANTIAKSPLDKINMEGFDQGVTVLMQAARKGDVVKIERLLKAGATVDIVGPEDGHTALFFAAFGESPAAIKALLQAGANLNFLNFNGQTPLVSASFKRTVTTVRALVEAGADLKYLDAAIENARRGSNTSVVEYLTTLKTSGATSSTRSTPIATPQTPAKYRATEADTALYRKILSIYFAKQYGSKVEASEWKDVAELLDKGATARSVGGDGDNSLLILASDLPLANDTTAQKIVARADIDAQNNKGQSALHIAAENNYTKMISWLIKAGANLNLLDKNNQTPMDIAVKKKNFAIIQLRDAGAKTAAKLSATNANATSSTRSAPINASKPAASAAPKTDATKTAALVKLLQAKTFDLFAAQKLMREGADANGKDAAGKTPLMWASERGTLAAVEWMVSKSEVYVPKTVDLNATDNRGMTALMHAANRADDNLAWRIVAELLGENADWKLKNQDGKTALDLANAKSNSATVTVLEIEAES